ncbi:YciI family protein [Shewanella submarina]|uniref:YciI family protein n=1 Tax=Shewanella submarina TaxID=2016376 RepID=A0ABV7GHI3_9GAMM|nr:YciI family protein [Shewanella submarina]MCL1038920.1 YciI family protein [Shewanella submarina]
MKFVALIYAAPEAEPVYGTPEFDSLLEEYMQLSEEYTACGAFVAGEGLQGNDTATSIRVRNGQTELVDGPFAETKEQLGGFYLLECKDLDEALRLAAKIPSARYGTVEVRPVAEY